MPDPLFTEDQIGSILREMWIERTPFLNRLKVRRILLEMAEDSVDNPNVGTWLPDTYKDSQLIFRAMVGDGVRAVQNYKARISANDPQVSVIPIAPDGNEVSERVQKRGAEQERLLMSMLESVNGRAAQGQVAWSQSWGRAGWYLTLPRDANWGLPEREIYDDLTDDEVEAMKRAGALSPKADPVTGKPMQSGENWIEHRRKASKDNAISGRSLFSLEPLPPDMVLPRYEKAGTGGRVLKYAFAVEELPRADFLPGSELMRAAAKHMGHTTEEDLSHFGIVIDQHGKITGGISAGGEPGSQRDRTLTLARFVTRNEVYFYVTSEGGTNGGFIAFHQEFGGDEVPLYPVPGGYTDSLRPGGEFTSHMEQVFAQIPIINQIETLLSNVGAWNGLGRFVVEDAQGQLLEDETGEPLILKSSDTVPGLDPGTVSTVKGKIRQLVIDGDLLLQLLQFYTARLDAQMPAAVTEGESGASQPAWAVSLNLDAAGDLLKEAVDNHADAIKRVMLRWIRWMRVLDEPIYSFAAPGKRGTAESVRGLIEFNPKDLAETISVSQMTQNAQQRTISIQIGKELKRDGDITPLAFYRDYMLEADPEQAEINSIAAQMEQLAVFGASETIMPGSVASDLAQALRGELTEELFLLSPAFALASATDMAENAAINANTGNVADATGARVPGVGMSTTQPVPASVQQA